MKFYKILHLGKCEYLYYGEKKRVIIGTLQGMRWLKGNIDGWVIVELDSEEDINGGDYIGFCMWWITGGVKIYRLTESGKAVAESIINNPT